MKKILLTILWLLAILMPSVSWAQEPYAVMSSYSSSMTLTFYYDDQKTARNGVGVGPFTPDANSEWNAIRENITSVVFDASFDNCRNLTSTAYWFNGCKNLTTISGIEYLHTDNVTDIRAMFGSCSSLTSIDLSHFNTESVTNFYGMFYDCTGLTSLDVTGLNTANATRMDNMFENCSGLTELDLHNFNTANVQNMSKMFLSCTGLTALDLSSFNTANVSNMTSMFSGCSALVTIYVGDGWSTAKAGSGSEMFYGCTSLVGGAGTTFSSSRIGATYAHIDGGSSNPGYFTRSGDAPYVAPEPYARLTGDRTTGITVTFYYNSNRTDSDKDIFSFEASTGYRWGTYASDIVSIVIDESFANYTGLTSVTNLLNNCPMLTSIEGLANLNTSAVTSMEDMFSGCGSLKTIDVSGLNTSNVTNMTYMFANCIGLTSLDLSSFNTSNLTTMEGLCYNCSSLSTIILPQSLRTIGKSAFSGCISLTSVHIPEGVMGIGEYAFMGAGLTSVDLPEGLESIGSNAFRDNPLTEITIPANVGGIGGEAFEGATTTVTKVTSLSQNPAQFESGDHVFASYVYSNVPLYVPTGTIQTYKAIDGWAAFQDIREIGSSDQPETYAVLSEANSSPASHRAATAQPMVLTFYYDTKKAERGGMDIGPFTNLEERPWHEMAERIENIIFDSAVTNDTTITSTAYWFYEFSNLKNIDGLQWLNTKNVTDMSNMFSGCSQLVSIKNMSFNTEKVQNMQGMFSGCNYLSGVDLSSFNTTSVTNMSEMFSSCMALESLDVTTFNTSNVSNMKSMFYGCQTLTTLDLSSFNTAKVENMNRMLGDCRNLKTIYVSDLWTTGAVNDGADMFLYSTSLEGGRGTTFFVENIDYTYARIDGGPDSETPGYFTDIADKDKVDEPYAVLNGTTLTFYYDKHKEQNNGMSVGPFSGESNRGWNDNVENITHVVFDDSFANDTTLTSTAYWFTNLRNLTLISDISNLKTPNVTSMREMFVNCEALTSLDVSHFNTSKVKDMCAMFMRISSVPSLDLSNFDTSNVTNMEQMFEDCKSLTTLDLGSFNTDKVENMSALFLGCEKLKSINLSTFNTSKLTSMYCMFRDCSALESLDIRHFDTSNVTNMQEMFEFCSSLTTLDLGNFNTEKVTNMAYMFIGCSSLTSLDLSNFDTHNVTFMEEMFDRCSSLTSLNISSFNTSNVTSMNWMFSECESLPTLDVSHFDTSKVLDMHGTFHYCSQLTELDISSFNTSEVTNMENMFNSCINLRTIYAGDGWTIGNVTNSNLMFEGNTKLVGGKGTSYDANHVDATYAHIDEGASNPGYFTRSGDEPYVAPEAYAVLSSDNTVLTFYYDKKKEERNGTTVLPATSASTLPWYYESPNITTVVFDSSFANDTTLTSTAYWFNNMSSLTAIEGISNLSTAKVTDMSYMFYQCSSLTSLDLGSFNTANVTNMSCMFMWCSKLESLEVSGFNTANVTNMSDMFNNCQVLTNLDVSNFITDNVTDMSDMFFQCYALPTLDVSGFNTTNVTDMNGMFASCRTLTTLDLSSFNTAKVRDMRNMLSSCSALKTIYGNTWSTENLGTFSDGSGSTSSGGDNIFNLSTSLVGGAGTSYDADHTDYTYAHIDGGADNPGYFTMPLSMGDANGDGSINIADAVATVTNILGEPANGNFYRYAADMNNDSVIDIFDVTLIVNAALNAPTPAPALTRGSIDYVAADAILLTSEENSIYMGIDQAQQYTAFQFDIDLPEGMSLVDVKLPGMTDHRLSYVQRGANQYRVVALSMSNEMLRPTNGHVIQLQVSNTAGESNVKVSNVLFVTPFSKTVTGIGECLNTTMATDGNIYNLRGEKIGKPKQQLGKGIYIMNHKKVIIK